VKKLLITIALLLSWGCQREEISNKSTTLRVNFPVPPASFDHQHATRGNTLSIFAFFYDGLYRLGSDGKAIPSVAKSVEQSPDGLRYTFHLKNTDWSNGDPVTAYDFERAWKWMVTPSNPSIYAERFYGIKNGLAIHEGRVDPDWLGAYAMDSATFIVELEEPCPYFLELISLHSFYPSHSYDKSAMNGPFVVEEYYPETRLVLLQNPRYWDKDHIRLDRVEISFVEDDNTELYLFEKGELDWAGHPCNGGLPLDALAGLPNIQRVPSSALFFYTFNVEHPLLKNRKVRQALNLSINRDQIVKHITHANDNYSTNFVLEEKRPNIPSDADLKLLFEEGWREAGSPPRTFTLSYNQIELQSTLAQFIQARWNKLFGLQVKIEALEWESYLQTLCDGKFDCIRCMRSPVVNDPVPLLEIFVDPKHPRQHSNWSNSSFVTAFQKGRNSIDVVERKKWLDEAIAIFNEETPVAPLFYQTLCFLKNPKLHDEVISPMGMIDFKWAYFEESEK